MNKVLNDDEECDSVTDQQLKDMSIRQWLAYCIRLIRKEWKKP